MSKTGRATYITKRLAKNLYEQDGESFTAIGDELGYGGATISKWAKEEGWIKAGTEPTAIHDDDDKRIFAGVRHPLDVENPIPDRPEASWPPGDEAELRARIAALETTNAQLAAKNQELKPTRDIQTMLDDRVQWLTDNTPEGERYWLNRAEASFKKENLDRAKQGLPGFDIKEHPEILDDLVNELKTKEAMGQQGEPEEPPSRKVKLFIMRNGMPTIEQIPLENQINNMKGSLADGIIRYTRKGFKLTDPFLCPRAGCYKAAASDEAERWLYDGYCTDRHRAQVEGDQQSPTVGLTVRDVVSSVG